MVTSVARKPIKNRTMVICGYYGIVWQKSNIGFWASFQFQSHHPWYKITVSSLLIRKALWRKWISDYKKYIRLKLFILQQKTPFSV